MFARNLNLFLPYWGLGSWVFGQLFGTVISVVLTVLTKEHPNIRIFASVVGYTIPLLLIAFAWWKFGLGPKTYKPAGERRARIGHWIVAIANVIFLIVSALSLFLAVATLTAGNLLFFLVLASPFILIAWIVGLILIWSAYAPA